MSMLGQKITLEQHNMQVELQRRCASKPKAGVWCSGCDVEMEVLPAETFSDFPKTKVGCPRCGRTGFKL
jgi:predicted  nucleic acid-binding Zn-ribbon protein